MDWSPCKNLKFYDNPFYGFEEGLKKVNGVGGYMPVLGGYIPVLGGYIPVHSNAQTNSKISLYSKFLRQRGYIPC